MAERTETQRRLEIIDGVRRELFRASNPEDLARSRTFSDALEAMLDRQASPRHSCSREINRDGFGMSGWRQDGEVWTCSCGTAYVHVCDEGEGCSWEAVVTDGPEVPSIPSLEED